MKHPNSPCNCRLFSSDEPFASLERLSDSAGQYFFLLLDKEISVIEAMKASRTIFEIVAPPSPRRIRCGDFRRSHTSSPRASKSSFTVVAYQLTEPSNCPANATVSASTSP